MASSEAVVPTSDNLTVLDDNKKVQDGIGSAWSYHTNILVTAAAALDVLEGRTDSSGENDSNTTVEDMATTTHD